MANEARGAASRDEPRLKTQVQAACRRRGYALATERTYWRWIVRFIKFHDLKHPRQLDGSDIGAFLSYLATERQVAGATQNQALNALVFLYEKVLERPPETIGNIVRAKKPKRLPTVLSRDEVRCLLQNMSGTPRLVASLLYGSGLRLAEGLRLRVKDLDFERKSITVRHGKGQKDRRVSLPGAVISILAGVSGCQSERQHRRCAAYLFRALLVCFPHLRRALRVVYSAAPRQSLRSYHTRLLMSTMPAALG